MLEKIKDFVAAYSLCSAGWLQYTGGNFWPAKSFDPTHPAKANAFFKQD